jgi:hypothetical protein
MHKQKLSAAARSMAYVCGRSRAEIWVRIPPGTWMSVCCECCVLSSRGLCFGLIIRPEELCRLWCVVVCDLKTSIIRGPWPHGGSSAKNKQICTNKYCKFILKSLRHISVQYTAFRQFTVVLAKVMYCYSDTIQYSTVLLWYNIGKCGCICNSWLGLCVCGGLVRTRPAYHTPPSPHTHTHTHTHTHLTLSYTCSYIYQHLP